MTIIRVRVPKERVSHVVAALRGIQGADVVYSSEDALHSSSFTSRYSLLGEWLNGLVSAGIIEAVLSLTEIEEIIDGPLPASASKSGWWSSSQKQSENWTRYGWAAVPELKRKRVCFHRSVTQRR